MHPGGRPRLDLDIEQVHKLGVFQATMSELAAWFHVSESIIDKRLADTVTKYSLHTHEVDFDELTFRQVFENGKLNGRANLRRMQMIAAQKGNATMLIWLGKQLLGQRDNLEVTGHGSGPVQISDVTSARETLTARLARIREREQPPEDPGRSE